MRRGRLYQYVGPRDLLALIGVDGAGAGGYSVPAAAEFHQWVAGRSEVELSEPFTYVVDATGTLRLAARRSEHVVCANGREVLAAGEVAFRWEKQPQRDPWWAVAEVSNHSTGYCPDVDCWPAVAQALERAGLAHPGRFTHAVIFRRCEECRELNIVRDGEYFCVFCEAALPVEWNVQSP